MQEITTTIVNAEESVSADKTISANAPYYFTVSTKKLVIMSLCTLGFYKIYWFYKNWVVIKNNGKKCNPALRSVFSPFFSYSCFRNIKASLAKNVPNVKLFPPIGTLAVLYIAFQAASRLPDPYWLISALSFLPIIPVNRAAILINESQNPDYITDKNFSKLNITTIVLGGLLLICSIIGTIL